jgi:hypothetical protein
MRPTNRLLLQYSPPQSLPEPRPRYLNRIISRLRKQSWYTLPSGPEYFYYKLLWNPAMKWRFHDVQGDFKLQGPDATVKHFDEQKGFCIVYCTGLITAEYLRVTKIGTIYDPRQIY